MSPLLWTPVRVLSFWRIKLFLNGQAKAKHYLERGHEMRVFFLLKQVKSQKCPHSLSDDCYFVDIYSRSLVQCRECGVLSDEDVTEAKHPQHRSRFKRESDIQNANFLLLFCFCLRWSKSCFV